MHLHPSLWGWYSYFSYLQTKKNFKKLKKWVAVSNNFNELASIMTEQLFLNIPEGKKKVDDMAIVYKWNRQGSFEDKEL